MPRTSAAIFCWSGGRVCDAVVRYPFVDASSARRTPVSPLTPRAQPPAGQALPSGPSYLTSERVRLQESPTMAKIIYTHTDEAPLLATYSFLPIIQAYAATAGVDVETRDISLAGRIIAQFPDRLDRRAAHRRRARRARRAGQDARGQHHQAAQHQRLDPAAEGRDRRAAGAGLRPARLPRRPDDRRGEGRPRPLRQGQGQRGQPGAARGQLRPPRARVGEELRPQAPALDGRLDAGLEDQRRAHDRRRLPLQREVRGRSRPTTSLRIELVGDDGTTTVLERVGAGARRRGRRRHRHARRRRCASSSPRRSPAPRPRTCCSRCTSRPR